MGGGECIEGQKGEREIEKRKKRDESETRAWPKKKTN